MFSHSAARGFAAPGGLFWDHTTAAYDTDGFNNPFFTDKFSAWEQNPDNSIKLHVFVDRATLEVFVDDGVQVCSISFFMRHGPPKEMELEAVNNSVTVQNLTAYSLKSIWR